MKKTILILLTYLSFNSLNAEFMDDAWRLKSFIYEMRAVSQETNADIERIIPDSCEFTPFWQYHKGKMDAYDDVIMWLEYNGGPWTSD